ncbi:MAG: aminotransferase class I/II-fold pyridoxal phosphate-dependent enzyme [Planctomycetes bacterium]|nr:aminotransferase class I/II-fold pyridoxal phosphate-dependent enzyme [Planctomycetota bacterium]
MPRLRPSSSLANVRYEIRGPLARRAAELEKAGQTVIKLNIGNVGAFGFRAPEAMRRAIVENLEQSDPYCPQKGIFPAREAVVMQQQSRGVMDVTADDVFMGNGVSELIMMSLRGLLNEGDEVLVPSPDYPLWTAAVTLNGGTAVHYPCPETGGFIPDIEALRALATPRTRALVIINPNNPTGAVYPKAVLEAMIRFAEERGLVVFADEIYDQIVYDGATFVPVATLCRNTLCGTFGGLSKVYRACGYRVGWLTFSGPKEHAREYLLALDLLAGLRLCSNVPGQWAVQTALGGHQSIWDLTKPGGRLYETRRAILDGVARSKYLHVVAPQGAIYAFVGVRCESLPDFSDRQFALELLERKHVLVTPGHGFNVPYADHFRITLLPEPAVVMDVFARIEEVLDGYAGRR